MGDLLLDDVTVRHEGVTAVEGVDLRVREGELLVLVGPSGCGKTTLLRTIAGLQTPDAGEVVIDGRRVTDRPARHRDVSLVFQDLALFPHLTARENLSFDLRMQGADDVDARVREAAKLLDVADFLDRPIDALSGGQQQRVALGRAMVTEPAAFLLDEPLSNLDASLRERMQREIQRLHDHLGTATVHVTHDQAEALAMGDRVAVLMDGQVEQVGTPEAVYQRPTSLAVARFVGSPALNCLAGRYDPDTGGVAVQNWPVVVPAAPDDDVAAAVPAEDARVVLGVRPEDVEIGADALDRDSVDGADSTTADGVVVADEFAGPDRYVHLDVPGSDDRSEVGQNRIDESADLVARASASLDVSVGATVPVHLSPSQVHYFSAATGERLALRHGSRDVAPAHATPDSDRA